MISWFKKHFIPHHGNDHKPHILRGTNTRNIVIAILLLEIFLFLIPTLIQINKTGGMAAVLPAILADLTNKERQTENLQTLTVNPILNKVAEMKASDMASKGYFAHTSPEGKTPWYWLEQVGYSYQYAGENLAVNFSDSKDVTNAWMASPTHRSNIIKNKYTEVGTGVATGIYEGKEAVFVAQVYANPLPKVIEKQINNNTVVKTETTINNIDEKPLYVLGAETNTTLDTPEKVSTEFESIKNPSFIQKIISSPRNTTNIFFFGILGIIFISIILYIFIKMKNHNFDLITNGLIIIVIIGAILLVNYYLSRHNMVITDSLDYSSELK